MTGNYTVKKSTSPPRQFSKVSLLNVLSIVFVEWCFIVGSLFYFHSQNNWALAIISWVLCGAHLHRLAVFGHDGAHFRFSTVKALNDLISNLFIFYPLGTTVEGYRSWHFEHHRSAGFDMDPERCFKKGRLYSKPMSMNGFLLMFLADCFGLGIPELGRLLKAISPAKLGPVFGLLVYWLAVGLLTYKFGLWKELGIFALSIFTTFWAFFRVRGWSEHIGIKGTYRFDPPLWARYLFFPHNTWCHYEHHKWPYVSCQKLQEARTFDADFPILTLPQLFQSFSSNAVPVEYAETPISEPSPERKAVGSVSPIFPSAR